MASFKWDKTGLFAAGVLFGTAGIKLLSSKDAEKSLHRVHSSCFKSKGLCNEDGYNCSGKCR